MILKVSLIGDGDKPSWPLWSGLYNVPQIL